MLNRLNIIAIGARRRGADGISLSLINKILFYGRMEDVSGGQMPNLYGTDYITVSGDPGSETFQCPDSGSYLSADSSERLWFDPFDIRNTVSSASLVGYDFTRTFVKYDDDTPYQVREIIILKNDAVLSSEEIDFLHLYMKLHWYWSGVFNANGVLKTNRGTAQIPWFKYGDELLQYTTGLITPLTEPHLLNLYVFVKSLKTGLGVSRLQDFFDFLYLTAGQTHESSYRNLAKNAHHITVNVNNQVVWTQYEGVQGVNVVYISLLKTNYKPLSHAVNYKADSGSIGLYTRTNLAGKCGMSNSGKGPSTGILTGIQSLSNNNYIYGYINSNAGAATPFTAIGMVTAIRSGTSVKLYSNSVQKAAVTNTATVPMTDEEIYMLHGQTSLNDAQIAAAYYAKEMTVSEDTIIRNAIEAYLDTYGKGVIA